MVFQMGQVQNQSGVVGLKLGLLILFLESLQHNFLQISFSWFSLGWLVGFLLIHHFQCLNIPGIFVSYFWGYPLNPYLNSSRNASSSSPTFPQPANHFHHLVCLLDVAALMIVVCHRLSLKNLLRILLISDVNLYQFFHI